MRRLEHLLGELRREVERLRGQAPGGDDGLDLTVLTDEELERVEVLVAREALAHGRTPGRRHRPEADAGRRGGGCGCEVCGLAEQEEPEPLRDQEREELTKLLARARDAGEEPAEEPWRG